MPDSPSISCRSARDRDGPRSRRCDHGRDLDQVPASAAHVDGPRRRDRATSVRARRRTSSPRDYLRMVLTARGQSPVDERPFECRWWEPGHGRRSRSAARGWTSRPRRSADRATSAARVTRLASDALSPRPRPGPGRIVVIDGRADDRTSYFPKAFPFLDLPEQRARIARLEALPPAAVIAAHPGAARRSRVLEDGDLAFPYLSSCRQRRRPAARGPRGRRPDRWRAPRGRRGQHRRAVGSRDGPRIVLSAHIDTKVTTPGAFDNAGGVATLLALAEAGLRRRAGRWNWCSSTARITTRRPANRPGSPSTDLGDVRHVVNLDGAGRASATTSPWRRSPARPPFEARVRARVDGRPGWKIGAALVRERPRDLRDAATSRASPSPRAARTSWPTSSMPIATRRGWWIRASLPASPAFLEDWLAEAPTAARCRVSRDRSDAAVRRARTPSRPTRRRPGTASRGRSDPRAAAAHGAAWPRSARRSRRSGVRGRSPRR